MAFQEFHNLNSSLETDKIFQIFGKFIKINLIKNILFYFFKGDDHFSLLSDHE